MGVLSRRNDYYLANERSKAKIKISNKWLVVFILAMVAIQNIFSEPASVDRRLDVEGSIPETDNDQPGHYVTLYIGDSQSVVLQVDLNSKYTAFPCAECTNCGNNHIDLPFNETASSSAIVHQCMEHCTFSSSKCIDGSNECRNVVHMEAGLGEEGGYKAFEVEDSVYLDTSDGSSGIALGMLGKTQTQKQTFLCQKEIIGFTKASRVDGVLGLANSPYSFVSQFYQNAKQTSTTEKQFSLCFSGGKKSAGSLNLGAVDRSHHTSPLVWAKNTATKQTLSTYAMQIRGVYMGLGGGNEPLVRASQGTMSCMSIDSHDETYAFTTGELGNALFEPNVKETMLATHFQVGFEAAFKKIVGLSYLPSGIPLTKDDIFRLPTIFLQFEAHQDVQGLGISFDMPGFVGRHDKANPFDVLFAIPPEQYLKFDEVLSVYKPLLGFHSEATTIGWQALAHHEVVFDLDKARIGFAERKECSASMELGANGDALGAEFKHREAFVFTGLPTAPPAPTGPFLGLKTRLKNFLPKPNKGSTGSDIDLPKLGHPDWRPWHRAIPNLLPEKSDTDLHHREAIIFTNLPTAPPVPLGPIGRLKTVLKKYLPDPRKDNHGSAEDLPNLGDPGWRPWHGAMPSMPNITLDPGSSDLDVPKSGDPDWRPWHGARANLPGGKSDAESSDADLPKFGDPDWRPWQGARPMGKPGEERHDQEIDGHFDHVGGHGLSGELDSGGSSTTEHSKTKGRSFLSNPRAGGDAATELSNATEAHESNVILVEGTTKTQESYAGLPTPLTFGNGGQSRGRAIAESGTNNHEVYRVGPSISGGLKNTKATKHGNGLWNLVGLAAFFGAFGLTAYVTRDHDTLPDEKTKPDVHPSFFEKGPEADVEAWAKNWDETPDDRTVTTGASDRFHDEQPPMKEKHPSLGGTERLSNRSFGTTNEAFEDEIVDEEQRPRDNRSIYSKDDDLEQQRSYYSQEDDASFFVNKPPPSIGRAGASSYASKRTDDDDDDNGSLYKTKPSAISSYRAAANDDASFYNSKQSSMKSYSKHGSSQSSKPSSYPFIDDDQSAFGQQSFMSKGDGRSYHDGASKADQHSYYSSRSFSSRSYTEGASKSDQQSHYSGDDDPSYYKGV